MDSEIQSNGGAKCDGAVRSMKCSATANYRKRIKTELGHLKSWTATLENTVAKDDDVIPWLQIDSLLRSVNAIAYESGRLNGALMQSYESPNE